MVGGGRAKGEIKEGGCYCTADSYVIPSRGEGWCSHPIAGRRMVHEDWIEG